MRRTAQTRRMSRHAAQPLRSYRSPEPGLRHRSRWQSSSLVVLHLGSWSAARETDPPTLPPAPLQRRRSSAARLAPAATRRRQSSGARRSTSSPWTTRPTGRCWAISPARLSSITASNHASSARMENTWSRPMGRTASPACSRSSTRSASIRFSNIWSNLPTVDCRRSRWPGTAGRRRREVSAGSTFIPMRRSATMISCIGPS